MGQSYQLSQFYKSMFKLNYSFYIEVDTNGKQRPFMALGPIGNAQHLGHLAMGLSSSFLVKNTLEGIESVLNKEKEVYDFAGDDWCIVRFKKEKSIIINGFDEFEPFEIESELILKLMGDWYEFLLKWENNEIPGIIHPDKREAS
jgi:hypothetical protein